MTGQGGRKRAKVRGNPEKAQFRSNLTEVISETARIWRKHHLGYDQTQYVVEQARHRLKLGPLTARRRTVNCLDKSEVERLIRSTYRSHNKYGLMIKTLFLIGRAWTSSFTFGSRTCILTETGPRSISAIAKMTRTGMCRFCPHWLRSCELI